MFPNTSYCPPLAVGGIGGSGTRLIAEIMKKARFYIGSDLNEANDNLWFTLLFKRLELLNTEIQKNELPMSIYLLFNAMIFHQPLDQFEKDYIENIAAQDRSQHSAAWLKKRAKSLQEAINQPANQDLHWGWKEPNTHIFLDQLNQEIPGFKYMHVMRHGLDMAHSANQNQLKLWGPTLLGPEYSSVTPFNSLKYWCHVHRRVINLGRQMGNRFLLVDYDRLCSNPEEILPSIYNFLGVKPGPPVIEEILKLIARPESMGRYKKFGLNIYDPADVKYVRSLGFVVED